MSHRELMAVTVIGEDRPGIVAAIARCLFDAGCNLEDVSSTILRGHFSMVLVVRSGEGQAAEDLQSELDRAASELGVSVSVRPVKDAHGPIVPPTHMVSVYGADRPGIVYRIAQTLADAGVNITDLTSRMIGPDEAPVYALMLEVAAQDAGDLQERLRAASGDLEIDVTVRALETDIL